MPISDKRYNEAKRILSEAGSECAKKTHPKHNTKGGSPDSYGRDILAECRDEFREQSKGKCKSLLRSDMTLEQYNAIHRAAAELGIDRW